MVVPCLLCQCGSFTDLPSLISSLSGLAGGPLVCPLSHCGHTEVGLDNLIRHLSSHQAADSSTDNIEQVIRDLEDLVDSEIDCVEPQSVSAVSGESWPHVMAGLAPLPSWSCSQMQSSQSYQLYQTCQSLSNQVAATTSLSSLSPSQYPAPELSPSHYLESVTSLSSPPSHHTQAQLIGKM